MTSKPADIHECLDPACPLCQKGEVAGRPGKPADIREAESMCYAAHIADCHRTGIPVNRMTGEVLRGVGIKRPRPVEIEYCDRPCTICLRHIAEQLLGQTLTMWGGPVKALEE